MNEKRQYPRKECNLKVSFKYYEGDPENIDMQTSKYITGKGTIRDISKGGVFIVSTTRVSVNMLISLSFTANNEKFDLPGTIVRTGMLKNNPSEIVQKYANEKTKEDAYIAVQFDEPLKNIPV